MEQHIAILMADLSGYTALTETHGAGSAADLIEKYIHIAENCLVGNSKIHERTGDELMFIADNPDDLLATALRLEANTGKEEHFLQVHGGLHFGNVLKRGDHYFGTTINMVSRIAAKAMAGTFWCSDEFVHSVSDKTPGRFTSKGMHHFKNIHGEKEVFEININKRTKYIDPVCRMVIQDQQMAIYHPGITDQYFCSSQCLQIFKESQPFTC